jgi:hypothetical protein
MVKVEYIIIGLFCIGFLYFVPVKGIPISGGVITNTGLETIWGGFPLSQLASLCSNPIIGPLAAASNNGYNCQVYTGIFYISWIIGLVFIVYGLIPTKEENKDRVFIH